MKMARAEAPIISHKNGDHIRERSPLEIFHSGERTERAEVLQLSSVVTDYSLVDENHAKELGDSMSQDRGQISPIVVRPRLNDNAKLEYDVIDGFHRTEGQRQRSADTIKAIVVYGCTDEEMYDLRILAASSVKSVQFPRIAEWITRSYEQTRWKQQGVSVLQAFSIARNERDTSYLVKNKEDLAELKDWINDKCKSWQKSHAYVLNVLKIVDVADPELVRQVRTSGGGKDREAKVTPQRLQKIALSFPNQYAVQNEVMAASIFNRMSADETALLAEIVKPKLDEVTDKRQVKKLVQDGVLEVNRRAFEKRRQEKEIQNEFLLLDEELESINEFENEEKTNIIDGATSQKNSDLREKDNFTNTDLDALADRIARESLIKEAGGLTDEADDYEHLSEPIFVRGGFSIFDGDTAHPIAGREVNIESSETIEQLKIDRDLLRSRLEKNNGSSEGWWVTADYLPPIEKKILVDLFSDGKPIYTVSRETRIAPARIESLLRSALLRRQNYLRKV